MTSLAPVTPLLSHGNQWLHLTFHHPKGNIITVEVLEDLRHALVQAQRTRTLKFITLEGAGRDFSFGSSIREHAPGEIGRSLASMQATIDHLLSTPAPTAALVRGRCLGGGFELALACDLIFAADDAMLGLPEIGIGAFPPFASVLLPARVGHTRAARAVLAGEPRAAGEWVAAGLIESIASEAELEATVERWFETHLRPRSAVALSHAARAIRSGVRDQTARLLPGLLRAYLDELMKTQDAVEGVASFLEKRPPIWKDR
jgi:cyclohexa-1,5-dienecarbonyl-CoA hydratase